MYEIKVKIEFAGFWFRENKSNQLQNPTKNKQIHIKEESFAEILADIIKESNSQHIP